MKINRFEEILSWEKSKNLTVRLYKNFQSHKDFGFRDQILKASISIMNNIAEGFERGSDKDFIRFLYIAKASCAEIRSMLILAEELNKISKNECDLLCSESIEISRLLAGLIKSIKKT